MSCSCVSVCTIVSGPNVVSLCTAWSVNTYKRKFVGIEKTVYQNGLDIEYEDIVRDSQKDW